MKIDKKALALIKEAKALLETINIPDLVMITYEDEAKKYCVNEVYADNSTNKFYIDKVQDYLFQPKFTGRVIINEICNPLDDLSGFIAFGYKDIKEELEEGLGFRLNISGYEGITAHLEIIPCEFSL